MERTVIMVNMAAILITCQLVVNEFASLLT